LGGVFGQTNTTKKKKHQVGVGGGGGLSGLGWGGIFAFAISIIPPSVSSRTSFLVTISTNPSYTEISSNPRIALLQSPSSSSYSPIKALSLCLNCTDFPPSHRTIQLATTLRAPSELHYPPHDFLPHIRPLERG